MIQIAIRGVKSNPFRYLATALAIILGVAFFIATSVLTTSFRDSLNDTITEAFRDVDAAVRSSDTIDTDFFEIRAQIPASLAADFEDLPGVEAAVPYLAGYAQVVTAEGKTVDGGGGGAQAQGLAWIDQPEANPFSIVAGTPPLAPTDVVIDRTTFEDGDFALGDQVRILPLPADDSFKVVGVMATDASNNLSGQALAFTFDGAARVLGTTNVDQIFVVASDGVSQRQLVTTLEGALTGDLEAITGQELVDEFKDLIGTFASIINIALSVFAGIALFVGAFVIYNTFSITVAQRTKEMALLRAIGASGRQVSISVIVEAVIIGIVGSLAGAAVGIALGWGLLQLLGSFAGDFDIALTIPAGTMVAGMAIGTFLTVFAAFVPARRGARVAPIEALRDSAIEVVRGSRRRTVVGLGMLGAGVAACISAVAGGGAQLLLVGLPFIFLAVALLGPVVVKPVTRVLAVPLVRGGSIVGELARENAGRNPKRTATTSLTLMIGVALMVTATVFAATLSTSLRGDLEDQILATDVVEIGAEIAASGGGLDPTIAPAIGALPGVEASVPLRGAPAEVAGSFAQITGADTSRIDRVLDLDVLAGTVVGLDASSVALSESAADDRAVGIGDTIDVKFQEKTVTLTVAGIYDREEVVGEYLVDNRVLEAATARSLDSSIFITADSGAAVDDGISRILAGDPTAKAKTAGEYIDDQAGAINQLLILLYGLLGLSVIVALIGIVNTMALSIHERTRELGLLRAVGMNRTQLRRTIRYESALVALMGTSIGLLLGIFMGWLAQQAGGDTISQFTVPWSQLVVIAVIGILSGVAAGILPARRAGRLNVLDAIATA